LLSQFRPRVIPCLLLKGGGLVKTTNFDNPKYLGDPRNVVKIFNEKEADELCLLDITATLEGRSPAIGLLREISSECFMPLAYGGGIGSIDDVRAVIGVGVEKVVINSAAVVDPKIIEAAAKVAGSSSVVASIDARRSAAGTYEVMSHGGKRKSNLSPQEHARIVENSGAGEILINSIDRDGTMKGYDLELVRSVATAVTIPVIACGGAGRVDDLFSVVRTAGASAAAAGSLFVFHGRHRAVLISYPSGIDLDAGFRTPASEGTHS
jgi:cyclase